MESPEDQCQRLRDPGFVNLVVSIIIVVGLLISYLPQHYRIISRRTSEGISPYFVLLGTTSATAGFANILTQPQSIQDAGCCKELETFQCMAGVLGIVQLGMQFVLFLVFFRFTDASVPEEELENAEEEPNWQTAIMVASIVLVHMLLTVVLTAIFALALPTHLTSWSVFNGVLAAGLAAIQYIPQITMTYHLKHVGSLSIPMMCIQTPGGFLFAASLAARLGWAGWSTWGIYLLTAFMQGSLLCMALYYIFSEGSDDETARPGVRRSHSRVYANGLDENTATTYSGHPEQYATSNDQLGDIIDRQEAAAASERQPLLKPGGIGTSSER